MVPELEQDISHPLRNFMFQFHQVPLKFQTRPHHDFRGRRRRRSPHIRHEVGDREISFVPNAADDGNRARRNRARHDLLIECPKVLDRSTAARQQNHVHQLFAVEIFQRRDNIFRRSVSLHAHRIHHQMQIGKSPAQDANNVPHGRPFG